MDSGEWLALDISTSRPVRLRWRHGVITSLEPAPRAPEPALWLAPPLFDVQVNGYAGVDFQQDGLDQAALLHAVRALRRDGCGRILLTLITDDWARLTARLRHLVALRAQSFELQAAIPGWHIEGPFLSEQPGFHGAHDPACMIDPTPAHIQELRSIVGDTGLLLTLAPERRGAIAAIRVARELGCHVSLGHTDASAELLAQAVAAGATRFTHLGNGCPRQLDRHDNILWRVLETPGLMPSLIPDQIHVSPAPFRLFHQLLQGRVGYTTDAMAAAGAGPGRYRLGRLEVEVGADQIVRQPGQTNFAGSALRPIDGVWRAAQMLNVPWQQTWQRFARPAPCTLSHPRGEEASPGHGNCIPEAPALGNAATFCLVREAEPRGQLEVQTIWNG